MLMQGLDIDNFLWFWNGMWANYDGVSGFQCEALVNFYSRWIGGGQFFGPTADLIYQQPQNGFYQQIENSPTNYPEKGDIVVWNWPHTGVATGNNTDVNQLEVLEQNDPEGSNCHVKLYANYDGVIGWLRASNPPK